MTESRPSQQLGDPQTEPDRSTRTDEQMGSTQFDGDTDRHCPTGPVAPQHIEIAQDVAIDRGTSGCVRVSDRT
jgi:hypothetical protein